MDYRLEYIYEQFSDAKCELNYNSIFELLMAVTLSAQTTDKKVNDVTMILFDKYKTIESLADADIDDVRNILKPLGMENQKSKKIVGIAKKIHEEYNDIVPEDYDKLISLPGVGHKTISVVYIEGFKKPAFPVDTHINRVAKRLYLANINDDVIDVERKLKKKIDKDMWGKMHHCMIFFGRYKCKAVSPLCDDCKLSGKCRKNYK